MSNSNPPRRRRKADAIPDGYVQISDAAFRDCNSAWVLLRQLAITLNEDYSALDAYQKDLLHAADNLPAIAGIQEKPHEETTGSIHIRGLTD